MYTCLGLTPVHLLCEKSLTVMTQLMQLFWKYDKKCLVRETSYDGANAIGTSFKLPGSNTCKSSVNDKYFLNRDCTCSTKMSIKFATLFKPKKCKLGIIEDAFLVLMLLDKFVLNCKVEKQFWHHLFLIMMLNFCTNYNSSLSKIAPKR